MDPTDRAQVRRRRGDRPMAVRVVQWTTGNVGQRSVRAVVSHPDLELIGCYAWSPDKVGRDVGELCGIDPVGVTASNDIKGPARPRSGLRCLQSDVSLTGPSMKDA